MTVETEDGAISVRLEHIEESLRTINVTLSTIQTFIVDVAKLQERVRGMGSSYDDAMRRMGAHLDAVEAKQSTIFSQLAEHASRLATLSTNQATLLVTVGDHAKMLASAGVITGQMSGVLKYLITAGLSAAGGAAAMRLLGH